MSLESIFRVANFLAVIGWIVLILAAMFNWRRAMDRVAGTFIPVALAIAYVVVVAAYWAGTRGDISSLSGLAALFHQPAALLAGWLHYLAFDMLIGTMLAVRMIEEGMPRLLLLVVLPLTFFLGPAGFLAFQAIRVARRGGPAPAKRRA